MKTYTGSVTPRNLNWTVMVNGKPLPQRQDLHNHSPDGFAWGYGGSGPAQLALAILADCMGPTYALEHYQAFKWSVIAALPQDEGFTLTEKQIQEWARTKAHEGEQL